jgi:hypothetical protein
MKRVAALLAVCVLGLGVPTTVFAGNPDKVDPALMQPALNPAFAPWDCWRTGDRIVCEGSITDSYEGLEVDFLACEPGPIYSAGTYTSIARRIADADGNALKTTFRDSYVEWFTEDPEGSGLALRSTGHRKQLFEYSVAGDPSTITLSTIGVEIRVTGPGFGVPLHDVGVRTWDSEGNLLKSAGSHITEESFAESHARICNAFGQEG